jgi:hypothetical protein
MHHNRRWGSFCTDIPLEHLANLNIPILFVRNQPQADYIKLEFLRLGKMSLTNEALPGCNHGFTEAVEEDGVEKMISHREKAFTMVADWFGAS